MFGEIEIEKNKFYRNKAPILRLLSLFLKEFKYTKKKVVRHIHNNLSGFSYFSDESDKE